MTIGTVIFFIVLVKMDLNLASHIRASFYFLIQKDALAWVGNL